MTILLNGEKRDFPEATTVADAVRRLDLRPEHVAVEVNRALVPRARHAETALAEGDEVEVVTLVGGGAPGDADDEPTPLTDRRAHASGAGCSSAPASTPRST